MARPKKNKGKTLGILIAVLVIFAVTGVGVFVMVKNRNHLAKLPPFPVESYLEAENLWSYQNADFKLDGKVEAILLPPNNGLTLISFQPGEGKRRLPVLIQQDETKRSLRPQQELTLKVMLGDTQELRCDDYTMR